MNIRTILLALTAAVSVASFTGCDGDDGSGGSGGTGATGGAGGGTTTATTTANGGNGGDGGAGGSTNPQPPALGAQIDRMGRPAINTAVNHTFDGNPEQKDLAKDNWNKNKDSASWTQYIAEIQTNLAILDGIDTVCGNQLLADTTKTDPTRYAGLAGVLADDRLYINADGASCNDYLAVEAKALGVPTNDCGGRRMAYDVIDISYTLLVTGKLDGSVGDDIPISDAAKSETFPHMIAPK